MPADKVRAISSAIDNLDKKEWECVKAEMVEKGTLWITIYTLCIAVSIHFCGLMGHSVFYFL